MSKISIIIVNYKSTRKTIDFLKNIPTKYEVIIVDNSNDQDLKKNQFTHNVKIIETKNNGYGSAINRGRQEINSEYFFAFSPDLKGINKNFFEKFENEIRNGLKFAALGPRFMNVSEKSHKQSDINKKIGRINAISGSAIFFKTEAFDDVGGFDEKIFLFFEENDLCARFTNKKYPIYQLNEIKVFHPKGVDKGVVKINQNKRLLLQNFYGWHYMWSKFYHYKKNKLYIFAYIYFFPVLLRIGLKIIFYKLIKSKIKRKKYLMRFKGLLSSIFNISSHKRISL